MGETGLLYAIAALALAAAILSAVAVALSLRASRSQAEQERLARSAAEAAERCLAGMGEISQALAQAGGSLSALTRYAASSAAADRERAETSSRDMARLSDRVDDVRREVQGQLSQSRDSTDARMNEIRAAVERQLGAIRTDNQQQLERMRATVDEKLQTTLEERLSRSFKQVSDQLEAVYRGLGDMQGIAQGVGDLKKVLSGVKTRGILGEVQLGAILAEILAPDQYVRNVATKPGSTERVEFAVRIPVEGSDPVLMPIDAKFPGDTYTHLRDAQETGDSDAVSAARRALEQRIKQEAKDIASKYISVPRTTNFAILFLPFEGLYAEVVDTPGLVESLQCDFQVSVAGPSTMAAILNSLQMSYQSFAFQRRADEIQRVLSAVKAELPRYQSALKKAYDQINRAGNTVETLLTTRTRAMERKLGSVTAMEDDDEIARLLGEGDEGPQGEGES